MKLRRALATAAATAVIAPAALLAAPAAYASESPSPTSTETVAPTSTGTADPASAGTAAPTSTETTPETTSPAPTSTSPAPTTTGPTATPTPTDAPPCEEESDEAAVTTELRGLPSKVVAGSGWVNFTFRTTNVSDRTMYNVDTFVGIGAIAEDDLDDVSRYLTVQAYVPGTGWTSLGEEVPFVGSTGELKPSAYLDIKLRLSVDAKTPGSYGFAMAIGAYQDEDNVCGFSEAKEYDFDVLVAGSKPGPVEESEGKPSEGNHPAPAGEKHELPATGQLAETGSSSALPTIALLGGVTMAVGAGAVFVVRRRRAGNLAA